MKLLKLLNEVRYKTVLNTLSTNRKKPKAIVALRIKRVERGGSEAEINVTPDELIDIFRSNDFPARYRTSNYVYQVEMKKSKNNKRVAIVNIFNTDNLPDDIKLNEPADFDLNGAKVYLMTPDAVRLKGPGDEVKKGPAVKIGDTKQIDGKLHTWDGTKWIPEPIASKFKIGDTKEIDGKLHTWDGTKWILKTSTDANNNTSTAKTVPPGTPVLKRGSRGESVRQLQTLLGLTGDSIDGIYGGETAAWLMIWQEEHKLTADGIYGPKTAAAMEKDPSPVNDQERAKRLTNELRSGNAKPADDNTDKVGTGINIFKRLESKYPKVFKGSYTFKLPGGKDGKTVKRLAIGSPTQAETYEKAMKQVITWPALNLDETLLLNIFAQLSKTELTTLFSRYQQINSTKLPLDLKKNAFDESEMTKMENIFLKKGLNLASFMGSGAGSSF